MSRIAYVNGRYLPHADASVHIEDRGYQFADGVYEVVAVVDGRFIDNDWHLERLAFSLAELDMAMPMSAAALTLVMAETVRRNGVRNGIVYLQVSRGVARRDHVFPKRPVRPAVVVTARRTGPTPASVLEDGVRVITTPDLRWRRCDIKSVSLLPNVLAKQSARAAGAFEAWQVDDDGYVTEGGSTNAWIVRMDGTVVTRPAGHAILNGITRRRLLALMRDAGIRVEERRFTVDEARAAKEAFLTSTTSFVYPVVQIDDDVVGNGKPGSTTLDLRRLYVEYTQNAELPTAAHAAE